MAMTKAEIVSEIVSKTGVEPYRVRAIVEQFMDCVEESLSKGENVYLRGFGNFIVKSRAKKMARNISKNTSVVIPAHHYPYFNPSESFLRELVKSITMLSKDIWTLRVSSSAIL